MAKTRDDFTVKTVDVLGKRVGFLCSNPDCAKHTIGPNSNPEKATIVGIAAHITAASPGGPRYDVNLTQKERKSIENGIWLCANCSIVIDKDPATFSVELLYKWKEISENAMSENLRGKNAAIDKGQKTAKLEVDLLWTSNMRLNRGFSEKNREIYGDKPILVGSPMIVHWQLRWEFSLVIYNIANHAAKNIQIKRHQELMEIDQLEVPNSLPALANMDIEARYSTKFEGNHIDADQILSSKIPKEAMGTAYELTYSDDTEAVHNLVFIITPEGIVNKHVS